MVQNICFSINISFCACAHIFYLRGKQNSHSSPFDCVCGRGSSSRVAHLTSSMPKSTWPPHHIWSRTWLLCPILSCFLRFCLYAHTILFVVFHDGLQHHSPLPSVHQFTWDPPHWLHSTLPACVPANPVISSISPSSTVCQINLHFTTSCLCCLHLGPKIQSQLWHHQSTRDVRLIEHDLFWLGGFMDTCKFVAS